MGFASNITRKIVFWNYSRTSWQWDVLCVLILVFIFLTPKGWFVNTAYRRTHPAQSVTVGVDVVGTQLDNKEIETRARLRANRPNAEIGNVRPVTDASGRVVAYEVDIR